MNKVTYFDVEYANPTNKSICQIGIMCEDINDGEPYYPELDIYINPQDSFNMNCVKVHGITQESVKNSPTFPEVWSEIEKYFTNAVVIGHNVAASDLDALVKNLSRYEIDIPVFSYICTYELAHEFIPNCLVPNYKLSTLCDFFSIDIDNEHDAFDDACACADLLKRLVQTYDIDLDSRVKKYTINKTHKFSPNYQRSEIRRAISEFYGVIRGFSLDNVINEKEANFIKEWRDQNYQYINFKEIESIIHNIDKILEDGIVTLDEIANLQFAIKSYLDIAASSPVTLATQILDGILKGIIVDERISETECKNLRQWLYDNIYLASHFPFDKTIEVIEQVLADSIITEEESKYLTSVIKDLLNPVETLRQELVTIEGKHICLSGSFSYGSKTDVESLILKNGGLIDSSVKKTTDILIIGNEECKAYSNGTYGTKVKKAMDYNKKGSSIQIAKESDFFEALNK